MPALQNVRHEAVAQAIIAQLAAPYGQRSNGRAYIAAGYAAKNAGKDGGSAEACASRLLKNAKGILQRVVELQELARRRRKITIDDIVDELEEARGLAFEVQQPSAAVAATSTKAKVLGLQIDRVEIGKRGDFSQATSTQDLAKRMIMLAAAERIASDQAIDTQAIDACLSELSRHQRALAEIVDGLCARHALPIAQT